MAEKILRVPLNELKTLRLVCQHQNCGGVAEIPTARLEALDGQVLCPSCGHAFQVKAVGTVAGLKALGMSLKNLIGEETFVVEFVVSEPDG